MFQLATVDGRSVTLGGTLEVWSAFGTASSELAACPLLSRMPLLDGEDLTTDDLATLKIEVATLDGVELDAELREMLDQVAALADGGGDEDEPETLADAVLAAATMVINAKHLGPGDHPSGTSQSVHGGREGVGVPSVGGDAVDTSDMLTQQIGADATTAAEKPKPKPKPKKPRSLRADIENGDPNPTKIVGDMADTIQLRVRNSGIPESHMDGLHSISGEMMLKVGGSAAATQDAAGLYFTTLRTVQVSSTAPGVMGVDHYTIQHEIGHHVHMAKLTPAASAEWAKISNGGKNAKVSAYARTNTGEHFAEAYGLYHVGKRGEPYGNSAPGRHTLQELEPEAHAFMEKLDGNLLPKGKVTAPHVASRRYKGDA